jgi:hypothetical protein
MDNNNRSLELDIKDQESHELVRNSNSQEQTYQEYIHVSRAVAILPQEIC